MRTIAALFFFAMFGGACALAQTPAQPGSDDPPNKPGLTKAIGKLDAAGQPDAVGPVETRDQTVVDQIRGALQTGQPGTAPGILGDVLEVIRQRGSILDGSVLDPENEITLKASEPTTQERDPGTGPLISPSMPANVNVAESLLRSARLLESIPGGDEGRRSLIRQMRIQATRLLVQIYPH